MHGTFLQLNIIASLSFSIAITPPRWSVSILTFVANIRSSSAGGGRDALSTFDGAVLGWMPVQIVTRYCSVLHHVPYK